MKSSYRVDQQWNVSGIPFFDRASSSGIWSTSGPQLKERSVQTSGHSTYQPVFRH